MLPAADARSRRRCSPSSAARPAPASRRWSTPWSARRVTEPGVLRPTTRSPVLVHNPADADWFDQDRILPDLDRTDRGHRRPRRAAAGRRRHGARRAWPILDAPDIDSVEERNRTLAAQLLAAADLWLFVTSAARYADQVPWDFLQGRPPSAAPRSRSCSTAPPPDAVARGQRPPGADARPPAGCGTRRCSRSPRAPVDDDGLLPADARRRDPRAGWTRWPPTPTPAPPWSSRPSTARSAPWRGAPTTSPTPPAEQVDDRRAGCARTSTRAYDRGGRARSTTPPPTAPCCAARCWPAGRSSSAPASCSASLETKVGWLRDRVVDCGQAASRSRPSGSPSRSSPGCETLILEHAEAAAERAEASWRSVAAGQHAARRTPAGTSAAPRATSGAGAERAVRDWQHGRARDGPHRGRRQAHHRPVPRLRRQRALGRADGRGVRPHRRRHRRRGRHRRRQRGARARSCSRRSSATRPSAAWPSAPARTSSARVARADGRRAGPLPRAARRPRRSTRTTPERLRDAARRVDDLRFADTGRAVPTTAGGAADGASRDRAASRGPRGSSAGRTDVARPHRRPRRGRSRPPAAGSTTTWSTRPRGRRARRRPAAALRPTTRSSRSPARPGPASPRRSTRSPGSSSPRSAYAVPPRRGRWPAPGARDGRRRAARLARHPAAAPGDAATRMLDSRPRGPATSTALVLLDLPDHDSTEVAHHLEVDRLVKLADLLVWVLDPQKYADAAIHDRYLAPLATHRDVMLVVLNHIDTVPRGPPRVDGRRRAPAARPGRPRRRAGDRHVAPGTATASPSCSAAIAERVGAKKAVRAAARGRRRAVAARACSEANGDAQPARRRPGRARPSSVDAFADAAGVPTVVDAVERSTRRRAGRATGWPVTAWLAPAQARPAQAAAPRPRRRRASELTGARAHVGAARPTQVQRARVDTAVRGARRRRRRRAGAAVGRRRAPRLGRRGCPTSATASTGRSPPPTSGSPGPRCGGGRCGCCSGCCSLAALVGGALAGWRSRCWATSRCPQPADARLRAACRCPRCCCSAGCVARGAARRWSARLLVRAVRPAPGARRPTGGCGPAIARGHRASWSSSRSRPSWRPTATTRAGLAAALR